MVDASRIGLREDGARLIVGRVGALAVALGIGAAVVALPGLAQADTRGSGGASGSVDSAQTTGDSPSGPAAATSRAPRSPRGVVSGHRGPAARVAEGPESVGPLPAAARRAPIQPAAPVVAPAAARPVRPSVSAAVAPARTPLAAVRAAEAAADVTVDAPFEGSGPTPTVDTAPVAVEADRPMLYTPGAPVTTSAGPGTAAAPVTTKAPARMVPPVIQKLDEQVQATVRTVFNGLVNWVSTLPVNSLTDWMGGALLTVRKQLFNQSASVSAVQTLNTSEVVKGRIDVLDPEFDAYSIEVVDGPAQGTVALATTSQTEGRGLTRYTYTPGAGYAGSDQFVVKVSAAAPGGINVFHPFGLLDSRYYTVNVGSAAVSDNALGAAAKDILDTTLYLGNAGATVSVEKKGLLFPSYQATVTLSAASAARAFDWRDTNGRKGSVPVGKMLTENWDTYSARASENGVKPLLMFKYRDNGADNVVFVDVDKVAKNTDGTYTFTGQLSPAVADLNGRVDRSDFTGINYEKAFQNFLSTAGLKDCKTGAVCTTVGKVGTLGFTTLSPSSFVQGGGHDYPQTPTPPKDASATQTYPGAMGPGTTTVNQGNGSANSGNTSSNTAQLSAMTPWGNNGSFITATNLANGDDANNGVYLYTVNAPTGGGGSSTPTWGTGIELAGNGWNSQVNTMTTFTQVLTDNSGNPVPQTFAGTVTPATNFYTATGTISAPSTTPASFTGSINGSTMVVTNVASGALNTNDYVVGGPANNTQINSQTSGTTGGAGTYTVSPSQTFGVLTAGQGGSTLQLSSSDLSPAIAPFLMGQSVNGPGVSPGTTITAYSGLNGNTATYTVSTYNLVGPGPLAVYGAGDATGTISAAGTTPVSFVGSINGTTLTVAETVNVGGGTINVGDFVVGGPASNTQIQSLGTGTGGAGTYTVTPSQNWAPPTLTAGQGGTSLQLSLPSGVDPSSLVGAAVTGTGVAPGTNITGYSGTSGNTATYTVSTYNLVSATPLTVAIGGTNQLTLTVPNTVNPGSLIGQAISGQGVAAGTVITGYVSDSAATPGSFTYTVNNVITSPTSDVTVATPNLYQTTTGLVVGLADGSVQYWNGLGCSQTTSSSCTGASNPSGQANYGGGWTQLIASNAAGWGEDNPVNTIVTLPNNLGFMVGLGNGSVQLWNSTILPDGTIVPGQGAPSGCGTDSAQSCWIQEQGGGWSSAVNTMIASGQNGGVTVGLADGSVQQLSAWNGGWTQLQGTGWNNAVNTMMPYDGTTFIGGISATPVVASGATATSAGSVTTPSWAPANSPALAAAGATCPSSYTSGAGVGCGGYVLTVQSATGTPLKVGQTLYGGAGLVAGTTITAQISDGDGNLCSASCDGGGAGVYFVDNPQLIAPGTPMSASDGTRFILGLGGGAVEQYTGSGWNQLQDNGWSSVVNAMIPWRDGLVLGLNNGAIESWNPGTQTYPGVKPSGWTQLQGTGWDNAVTAMVPLGDGFAVGLTAYDSSQNGTIQYYTGFGPSSTTQPFGPTNNSDSGCSAGCYPQSNGNVYAPNNWTQIADSASLDGTSSIQQLIPLSVNTSSNGGMVLGQSLIAGQTSNGIYAWSGSTWNQYPPDITGTGSQWQMIQASDAGSKPVLTGTQLGNAWNFVSGGALPNFSESFGQPGGVGDPTAVTGDPVFGLTGNQAPCANNNSCSGSGDYYTFSFSYPVNGNGVLYAWPSDSADVQADINLEFAGYGYIFVPNGTWDKFHPDDYALGMVLGAAGGPSAIINVPNPSITLGPYNIPVYSKSEPLFGGLGGIVTVSSGITITAGATANLGNSPITLASYSFIPGILLTWNVAGYQDNLAMTGAYTTQSSAATFDDIVGDLSDPSATANITITPSLNINWGYTIPNNVPFVGGDGLVNLGMGYSNPVELQGTANLDLQNPGNSSLGLTLSASGQLGFNAALLPGITSALSWNDTLQLYNYVDNLASIPLPLSDL